MRSKECDLAAAIALMQEEDESKYDAAEALQMLLQGQAYAPEGLEAENAIIAADEVDDEDEVFNFHLDVDMFNEADEDDDEEIDEESSKDSDDDEGD